MTSKIAPTLRILIVDDSDIVRGAIRQLLREEHEQFTVYESDGADGAIQQTQEVRPDVVLLDLSIPGVSGIELANRLRRDFPEGKVVLMSAQDPTILQKLTNQAGLELCIAKSELSSELLPLLEKIAAG
jgi:DNA-binding NarL/FixJ family response regulator